jgi:hypothetical protein
MSSWNEPDDDSVSGIISRHLQGAIIVSRQFCSPQWRVTFVAQVTVN